MKLKMFLLAAGSLIVSALSPMSASADILTCRMVGGHLVGEGCRCRAKPVQRCGAAGAACVTESVHYRGDRAIKRCCVKWACGPKGIM